MKVQGLIITTTIEQSTVEMDCEGLPPEEVSELFMKIVLTLGKRVPIGKDAKFLVTGINTPSIEEIAKQMSGARHAEQSKPEPLADQSEALPSQKQE